MNTPRVSKLVFAHDHLFYQAAEGAWFSRGGQYSAATWNHYLEHCDRLTVAARHARLEPFEDRSQLSLSTHANVSFVPVPSLAGVGKLLSQRGAARQALAAALHDADLLIARLPSQTGLLAIEVARDQRKPWAVECVGCAWDAHVHHTAALAKLYAPLARMQMRRAIEQAPVVSYVTEQFLQQRYPTRGVAIACSDVEIAIGNVTDIRVARLQRIASQGGERPLRFGLIGSFIHTHKGVDVALRALCAAQTRLPPFELYVLGPGDPSAMMQLASQMGLGDAFKPCAPVPRGAAVQHWLDDIDVYLQPSRYEAMPRALIEAMARGCPALASDSGGIAELLPAACLHPPGDAERLAQQLIGAANPAWQQVQAQHNIEYAQRFDRDALSQKRVAFWQAVTALTSATVAAARAP
jgi:glycosyltransferase involved in cell wall biosynthesis